jgi:hypothetical protein
MSNVNNLYFRLFVLQLRDEDVKCGQDDTTTKAFELDGRELGLKIRFTHGSSQCDVLGQVSARRNISYKDAINKKYQNGPQLATSPVATTFCPTGKIYRVPCATTADRR